MPKITKLKLKNKYYRINLNPDGKIIEDINLEGLEYSIYNEILYVIYRGLKCEILKVEEDNIYIVYEKGIYSNVLKDFSREGDSYYKVIVFDECLKVFARRRSVKGYNSQVLIEYEIKDIEELKFFLNTKNC